MQKSDLLKLAKEDKLAANEGIRSYLLEHFSVELSGFQTDMFLDFLSEHVAKYYYNQAVADCMAFVNQKTEDMYLLVKE